MQPNPGLVRMVAEPGGTTPKPGHPNGGVPRLHRQTQAAALGMTLGWGLLRSRRYAVRVLR